MKKPWVDEKEFHVSVETRIEYTPYCIFNGFQVSDLLNCLEDIESNYITNDLLAKKLQQWGVIKSRGIKGFCGATKGKNFNAFHKYAKSLIIEKVIEEKRREY